MAASGSADTVLKILSGVQSGVDIVLAEGEYALGSADDDDIQLFDVSLSPAHVRIAIRQGKVEVAGGAGSLKTGNGITLDAGGGFQEIEPLDIVTAGASRFALGPKTANWASIVNVGGLSQPFPAAAPKSNSFDYSRLFAVPDKKTLLPVAIVLLLAVALFAMSYRFSRHQQPETQQSARTDLELVDASLQKFAFSNRLETRQELDGAVFVTGYVTTPVERRAALGAIRDTEVPAKIRISVTDMIRNEISNFLDSENTKLAFDLSETGDLTLSGNMLDADRYDRLTETIRERILGVASITSQVRTGPSLLQDVQALADRAQIVPFVLLRRDGELIEASGVIPIDKIDAWAGFLQAYSTQLAPIIGLRSLVVLQDPLRPDGESGDGDHKALFLGANDAQGDGLSVDVNRLKAGSFDLSDIFVGQPRQPPPGTVSVSTPPNQTFGPRLSSQPTAAANGSVIDLEAILGGNRTKSAGLPAGKNSFSGTGGAVAANRNIRVVDLTGVSDSSDTQNSDLQLQEDAIRSAAGMPVDSSEAAAVSGAGAGTAAGSGTGNDPAVENPRDSVSMTARQLIENWDNQTPDAGVESMATLMNAMRALEKTGLGDRLDNPVSLPARYGRMLANLRASPTDAQPCWNGSQLTASNALGTLFWLDLLSVTNELSLTRFSTHFQELMLEAALNPAMTGQCVEQQSGTPPPSVYLYEVLKNPDFVRHVLRDTASYTLDVTGASLAGERYIQTRSGLKLKQGAGPDEGSRILTIGELGLALEQQSGYASVIFNETLNWLTQ